VWGGAGLALEIYALRTGRIPTLSATLANVLGIVSVLSLTVHLVQEACSRRRSEARKKEGK
jgi:hypothetical protein